MSNFHWSVVPALIAAAWLTLAGATIVTVTDVPMQRSAPMSLREDLPVILVVASR